MSNDVTGQATPNPVAAAVEAVRAPEAEAAKPAPQTPDPRIEAYARKERQLQKMRQELEAERAQIQAQKSKYDTDYVPKSRLTEDPLAVLNEAGMSYEKLTELILSQPNQNDPTIRALRAEIRAINEKQSLQEKQAQDNMTKQYQQALKQIKTEVTLAVDGNAEYETIKESGMYDAVVELIEQTFTSEGYIMDIEEAAAKVEAHLVDEGYKMAQWKKVQGRLKPAPPTSEPQVSGRPKAQSGPTIKTLTHGNTVPQEAKRNSDKERRERAIAAFHGKLNQ